MSNKSFLNQIIARVDKEFPNSAMVIGTDGAQENPAYVFILLDDDYMYFGHQVPETDTLKIKKVDIDKISKVSFLKDVLTIQIKDTTFDITITTEEDALRAMCKEFKALKGKEATKKGGSIMDMDLEEKQLSDASYNPMRFDITPYGVQKQAPADYSVEEESCCDMEEKQDVENVAVEDPADTGVTKLFSFDELVPNLHSLSQGYDADPEPTAEPEPVVEPEDKPELEEMPEAPEVPFTPMLSLSDFKHESALEDVETPVAQPIFEEPAKDLGPKIHIDVIPEIVEEPLIEAPKAKPVQKQEKVLSKKEVKALDKQRKKEEKAELALYKKSHAVRNAFLGLVLVLVVLVGVDYSYANVTGTTPYVTTMVEATTTYVQSLLTTLGY